MSPVCAHIIVSGYVQGVGYRYYAVDNAVIFDVKGYVKNLPGGNVEVVAEGDKEMVESFIEKLKRGPYSATVSDVKVEWSTYDGSYTDFRIR